MKGIVFAFHAYTTGKKLAVEKTRFYFHSCFGQCVFDSSFILSLGGLRFRVDKAN